MPNDHSFPCDSHKDFKAAVTWVIGILIIVGGSALLFCFDRSNEARDIAQKAMDKSDTVDVIMVKVENIQEDVNELKYMRADITALKEMGIRGEARDQMILAMFNDYEFKTERIKK